MLWKLWLGREMCWGFWAVGYLMENHRRGRKELYLGDSRECRGRRNQCGFLMTQREVLDWNWIDVGRKGEQRAGQVMSNASVLGIWNIHKLHPPLFILSSVASAWNVSLLCKLCESYLSIHTPNHILDLLSQNWKWVLEVFNKSPKRFL